MCCIIKLKEFHFNGNNIQTQGAITMSKLLCCIVSLSIIDISSNNIGVAAATDLAHFVSVNTELQGLILSFSSLRSEGTIEILTQQK